MAVKCAVDSCDRKHLARGYCNRHYKAWERAQGKPKHDHRYGFARVLLRQSLTNKTTRPYIDAMRCDPCSYCGATGGTVDHITPRALNGGDSWANYTGACLTCNASKGTAGVLEFLLRARIEAEIAPLMELRARLVPARRPARAA